MNKPASLKRSATGQGKDQAAHSSSVVLPTNKGRYVVVSKVVIPTNNSHKADRQEADRREADRHEADRRKTTEHSPPPPGFVSKTNVVPRDVRVEDYYRYGRHHMMPTQPQSSELEEDESYSSHEERHSRKRKREKRSGKHKRRRHSSDSRSHSKRKRRHRSRSRSSRRHARSHSRSKTPKRHRRHRSRSPSYRSRSGSLRRDYPDLSDPPLSDADLENLEMASPAVQAKLLAKALDIVKNHQEADDLTRKKHQRQRFDPNLEPPKEFQDAQEARNSFLGAPGGADLQALAMANPAAPPFYPLEEMAPNIVTDSSASGIDNRKGWMEDRAIEIRNFMCDLRRPTTDRWSIPETTDSSEYLALPKGPLPSVQEDAKPVGLPILPTHLEHLRRTAYAKDLKQVSTLASTVHIQAEDFKCIRFSTGVTEVEAKSLGAITGKGPERILNFCTKSKDHKDPWGAAVASCIAPRTTLKTSMAIGSANAAITSARSEASSECERASELVADLIAGLVKDGILNAGDSDVQDMRTIIQSFSMIERRLNLIDQASEYIQEASLASTDASIRGLRTGLQQCRTHCTRAVFDLDSGQKQTDQAKVMEQTCLAQPYVPTSLFGGRLPHALHELRLRHHEFKQMNETVKDLGGGHMPKLDLVIRQGQPFRGGRGGGGRGGGQTRNSWRTKDKGQKSFGKKGGGGKGNPQQQQQGAQKKRNRPNRRPNKNHGAGGGGGGKPGGKPGGKTGGAGNANTDGGGTKN